jgi:hypothetical protein
VCIGDAGYKTEKVTFVVHATRVGEIKTARGNLERKKCTQRQQYDEPNAAVEFNCHNTQFQRENKGDIFHDPPLLAAVLVTSSSTSHMVNSPVVVGTAMIEPSSWTKNPSFVRSFKPYSVCKVRVLSRFV